MTNTVASIHDCDTCHGRGERPSQVSPPTVARIASLYRIYIGIAGSVPSFPVQTCRCSNDRLVFLNTGTAMPGQYAVLSTMAGTEANGIPATDEASDEASSSRG